MVDEKNTEFQIALTKQRAESRKTFKNFTDINRHKNNVYFSLSQPFQPKDINCWT